MARRRVRLLIALASAAIVLVAPQIAYAAPAGASAAPTKPTVWYDPVTHPVPHDVATGTTVLRTLASGGGCANTYGASSCISYRGSTSSLNADFYVNSMDRVSSSGTAYVYIEANGSSYYRYSALTNYIGHYPVTSLGVSSGSAWTIVDFYDSAGNYLMSAYSPTQWYP